MYCEFYIGIVNSSLVIASSFFPPQAAVSVTLRCMYVHFFFSFCHVHCISTHDTVWSTWHCCLHNEDKIPVSISRHPCTHLDVCILTAAWSRLYSLVLREL